MISQIDLMVIQRRGDDVKCTYGGPSKKRGKFVAWIELFNGDDFHRHILNTNDIFDSAEAAKSWAEKFVAAVRKMPEGDLFKAIPQEDLLVLTAVIDEVVALEKTLALAEKSALAEGAES